MERIAMQRLAIQINNRYPEAKIAYFNNIANGQIDFDTLLLLLSKMRMDENRFIIIEKIDKKQFYKFAKSLFDSKHTERGMLVYNFILIRGKSTALAVGDPKEIEFILKQSLGDMQNECAICCNDLKLDDNAVHCYHCRNKMCLKCAQTLFDTTLYWCPFCCHHLLLPQIAKPRDVDDAMEELDEYLAYIIQHEKHNICDKTGRIHVTHWIGVSVETLTKFKFYGATIVDTFQTEYIHALPNAIIEKQKKIN
jgi:hypothetical protein